MNTFIVICKDKENSLGKRLANRNFHLKYLQTLWIKSVKQIYPTLITRNALQIKSL